MRTFVAVGAMALGIATLPVTAAHAGSPWIVGIKASSTTVTAGHKVVFTGTVRPKAAAAGDKVLLQERFKPGKPWVTQRKAKIGGKGKYTLWDRPSTNTRHAYRVVMPATKRHHRGVSATIKVTVYSWQYLSKMFWSNNYGMTQGTVDVNGTSYKHSVYSSYPYGTPYREYNLDHKCTKVRATFGISDDSTTGGQAAVDVLSDGTNVYAHTFDLGEKEQRTVAIATPLKLRLESTSTGAQGTRGYGAFASAQALCTR
jgi:hypothetical protein